MKITLQPGETICVCFAGTDGQVDVLYDDQAAHIQVYSELADDAGRQGIIFDRSGGDFEDGVEDPASAPAKALNGPEQHIAASAPRAMGALASGERDMTDLAPAAHERRLDNARWE